MSRKWGLKLGLLCVVALLLFGVVNSSLAETTGLVQEATSAQQETGGSGTGSAKASAKTLTLEEAYELALENNIDLKKAALDYDSAIIDADQAYYNADEIDGDSVNTLQDAQTKYVSTKQKALAEDIAKQAYEIAREQTKILVEGYYYDVLKADNMVKVREASVKRAQEQLALVQKKFRAGSAIKTDVNRAEINLASAQADLANAQRDYKNAQVALNKALGLDVNTDIKPAQVLKYEKVTLPSVEELTKQALETRLDMQKAKNTQTIAQLNYDLVVGYQAPNTFSARKNKIELEKAKLDVLQQEQNIRADVISTLFQVQKADEVVTITARNLEQAKDNYSLAQRRYQIGVGTYDDVLGATVDLADAEAKYVEAVYNYSLAKNQLKTVTLVSE